MIITAHIPINPQNSFTDSTNVSFFRAPGFTEATLLPILHNYPNLVMWISGHRHVNVVTPQPAATSRGYAVGTARIFGATDAIRADTSSHAYNAELVKQLIPAMQRSKMSTSKTTIDFK